MNSELNVLVVSYTFPPEAEVGALRVARFCRFLSENGIRPVVLTVQEQFYRTRDDSLQPPAGLQVERTAMLSTPLDWYRRWKTRRMPSSFAIAEYADAGVSAGPGFFRRNALSMLQTPDPYWGWYFPAVRAGSRLIQQEKISAIFSSGPPWTPHLVARRLAKKFRLPWLADFRDPWAGNPWRENLPAWRKSLEHRLESSCVAAASRVACNTERLRQFFVQRYDQVPEEKFVTVTNGFDDAVHSPQEPKAATGKRLAVHLGKIYSERRIDTFCQALAGLVESGSIPADSLKVVFLGSVAAAQVSAAQQAAPGLCQSGAIEFLPRVSWVQAQEMLWSADVLLLFQGGFRMQVPAKFFEYWQTGKPIFAVAVEGALTDLLRETGAGIWAEPKDVTAIADGFLRAMKLPVSRPEEVQRLWASKYHFRALSARLAQMLREISASKNAPKSNG